MFYVAVQMLIGDRGKYLGIILGIAFASLIMTQQPGVFMGIMSRSYSFISDIDLPDIWVMDPDVQYVDDNKPLTPTQLDRVASVTGVEWAKPLLKGNIQVRLDTGHIQNCNLIGIDDATLIGGPGKMLEGSLDALYQDNSIIVNQEGAQDKLARTQKDGTKTPLKMGDMLELNDNYSRVVGIAETSRTFQSMPVIFTTYSRAVAFSPPQRNVLTYILVKAVKGVDPQKLVARISRETKLLAYTKDDFKSKTIEYYLKYTGIPINFGTSVLLGFLVGAAIAGQTFYNFTTENLRYFGVLKAMGISSKTLLLMIMLQSLIVGAVGYGVGTLGTFIFAMVSRNSILAFKFPWQVMALSILGVSFICTLSAFLSIRKVFKLETAIVFKG